MLKPLIFILIVVTLIALGLNLDFFTTEESITKTETTISKVNNSPQEATEAITSTKVISTKETNSSNDNNLSSELDQLLLEASKLFQKNEDSEAHRIYDKIIELSKNSKDPRILKYFADAHYGKAFLYNVYPTNDTDSAIEEYELILNKFENSNDTKLLKTYITAKLQQAQFLTKEEVLQAYDDLIKKFGSDKENRFQKEVEELQFSKSFALMGVNDEEAMEVLDDIIAKYQDKGSSKLPETVQYSILNNIELSIITGNNEEKYVDLANKYLSNTADTKPLLDMLNIVKNAQELEQEEAFEMWKEEHNDYHFPDWDFSELRKWADAMEDPERQARVRNYLDAFEKQKYNRTYATPYAQLSNEVDTDRGQNNDDYAVYEPNTTDEEPIEYEAVEYESDPYINDIYQNNDPYQPSYPSPEITYNNPYSSSNANGVSHNYNDPLE